MKISRRLTSLLIGTTFTAMTYSASATVISIDAVGKVDVKEAKTFQQRNLTDDTAAPSLNTIVPPEFTVPNLPLAHNSSPVVARVIKPSELIKDQVLDLDPENTAVTETLNTNLEVFPRGKPQKAPANKAEDIIPVPKIAKTISVKKQSPFAPFIANEAAKYDSIDYAMIEAVIEAESNNNPTAVSNKGAMGLMQLMPSTANTYNVINAFNPAENIRAGSAELARLMDIYDNPTLALAAYNAGQGAVEKHNGVPPYKETQGYVVKVLSKTFDKREASQLKTLSEKTEVIDTKSEEPESRPMKVYSYDW